MADKNCTVVDCLRVEQLRQGYCKPHYRAFRRFGDPLIRLTAPRHLDPWERLEFHGWQVVSRSLDTPCWEFQRGWASRRGYGSIHVSGKTHMAHRISYEHFHGPIPEGMMVLHACDNPPCMNPAHLSVGNTLENTRDMMARGRHVPPTGSRNGRAVIDEDTVRQILDRRVASRGSYARIGDEFGVSMSTVALIISGKRWKHVYESWRRDNPGVALGTNGDPWYSSSH